MEGEKWDYLVKLLVVGRSKSGKSCLIRRFMTSEYTDDRSDNQDFFVKNILSPYTSKVIRLQIFEHSESMRNESMYRGIDGVIVTYESTDIDARKTVSEYLDLIRRYSPEDVKILLVATKSDLKNDLNMSTKQLGILDAQSILCAETSAKENLGVDAAFFEIIKSAEQQFKTRIVLASTTK